MTDADSLLRERLDAAAAVDVDADPQAVRVSVARRQRRIRRRRRTTVLVGVLAAAGVAAGVVGLVNRDTGGDVAVSAGGGTTAPARAPVDAGAPHFTPAPGWEAVQTDASATAANVALGPATKAGDSPWDTVAQLGTGDVVLLAMFRPVGDGADGGFPARDLPLSLGDAQPGDLEGQPPGVYAERLFVQVDGWNMDVIAFYGGGAAPPSAETRAAAQDQLGRLVVPPRPVLETGAAAARSDACQPSDLVAEVSLDGSGGSLAGHITVRNVGSAACTLSGRAAAVEPRDSSSTVMPATEPRRPG